MWGLEHNTVCLICNTIQPGEKNMAQRPPPGQDGALYGLIDKTALQYQSQNEWFSYCTQHAITKIGLIYWTGYDCVYKSNFVFLKMP